MSVNVNSVLIAVKATNDAASLSNPLIPNHLREIKVAEIETMQHEKSAEADFTSGNGEIFLIERYVNYIMLIAFHYCIQV